MKKRPQQKRNIVQEIADEVRPVDSVIELFRGIQFRGGIKDRAILHSRLNELLEHHAKASESARERETGELKSRMYRYQQAIRTLNHQHAIAMNEAIGGVYLHYEMGQGIAEAKERIGPDE